MQGSLNDPEPPSQHSEHPACWDVLFESEEFHEVQDKVRALLEADIRERDAIGTEKYGVRLHPYNGRNSLHDIYQEQLDALVYSVKYLYEVMTDPQEPRTADAYNLFTRTLELVVATRRLILKIEGR